MKKINFKFFLLFLILITILLLYFNCSTQSSGSGGESKPGSNSDFSLITNSGNITLRLLNANTVHNGNPFRASAETPYYQHPRVFVNKTTIINDNMSAQLENEENDVLTFHNGAELEVCCFIDTNDDGPINDGDYLAFKPITINGNTIVDFNYPVDFEEVINSGNITVRLLNANTDHNGVKCASSAETPYSPSSRVSQSTTINSDTMNLQLEDENTNFMTFHGGAELGIYCYIDANDDFTINDGDYLAFKPITINGNTTVDFNYPGDFTVISNSGNITVRLLNANTDHNGIKFGACAETPYTSCSRAAKVDTIISDNMNIILEDANNDIMTFHGGAVLEICCLIDANDSLVNDGDYIAFKTITINGNTTVDFNY